MCKEKEDISTNKTKNIQCQQSKRYSSFLKFVIDSPHKMAGNTTLTSRRKYIYEYHSLGSTYQESKILPMDK